MPRSFLSSLGLLVRFTVGTAPLRSALLGVLAVVDGLLLPAVMAATGHAVTRAEALASSGGGGGLGSSDGRGLLAAVVLIGVLFAADQALAPVRDTLGASIGSAMAQQRRERLLAVTLRPAGVGHLEDSAVADEIRRAGDVEWDVGALTRIVGELGRAVSTVTAGLGAGVLLAGLAWWAPVLLLVAMALTHVLMHGGEEAQIREKVQFTGIERRADYYRDLSLDPPMAKEARVFGLDGFLAERTRTHRLAFLSHIWRARRLRRGTALAAAAVVAVANAVVIGHLAATALDGQVDAGRLIVHIQAIAGMAVLGFNSGATDPWWVYQGTATIPHLLSLEARDLGGAADTPAGTVQATGAPRHEIRLEGVRFGYGGAGTSGSDERGTDEPGTDEPGTDELSPDRPAPARPVLDGIDLTIPAGTSLAIVGSNGAGKTTLLKLLARLHDPDDGRILVDGKDLRDYDLASWRRQIAVIFQDFVRYELSARDNVAFGRLGADPGSGGSGGRGGRDSAADRLAADRASALDLIESLPSGWDTTVARQYPGGTDLSGGQWQRIALARALRAAGGGARLLVLDEPTANLDVRAEADLFARFLELTAGTTTLLVTHRLSTVRHADRIAVLEHGRVAETGTHDQLLAADGRYAHMFRLQADRFTRETPA